MQFCERLMLPPRPELPPLILLKPSSLANVQCASMCMFVFCLLQIEEKAKKDEAKIEVIGTVIIN